MSKSYDDAKEAMDRTNVMVDPNDGWPSHLIILVLYASLVHVLREVNDVLPGVTKPIWSFNLMYDIG